MTVEYKQEEEEEEEEEEEWGGGIMINYANYYEGSTFFLHLKWTVPKTGRLK